MVSTDILSSAKTLTGSFDFGQIWTILTYGLLILLIIGGTGVFLFFFLNKKKYLKTVTFWVRNPYTGILVADRTIKAMVVKIDNIGNLVFRLKKPYETRNVIPRLKYPAKTNVYYVEYTSDGKIVEFEGITDFDDERREKKAIFRDDNTELGRSSMMTMNRERYEKPKFMEKYGALLVNIGAIVVIMVFLFLIAGQLIKVTGALSGVVKQMGQTQIAQSNILNSLNNILNSNNLTIR